MTDIEMLNAENARLMKLVIELRAEAVRLNAQNLQAQQPLTDEQINAGRQALPYDIEDKPEPWAFKEGVRFAEQAHGIGVKP